MNKTHGLEVCAVSHRFPGVFAVHEASLTVEPGRVHCLFGPSGSGKSTLLRLVAGLERLREGSICIDGGVVASPTVHVSPEARSVGFVFQDYALFPHLDVLHNVLFGMPAARADRQQGARSLLEQVGMSEQAQAMPHTLSGGQQQRVALARALARQPKVMLLDEPFSGLDVQLRGDVRETTLFVLKQANVATLIVTHDPSEALSTADEISVMREGRIEQTGAAEQVYNEPASESVARMFGPINSIDGALVRPERVELLDSPDIGAVRANVLDRTPLGSTVRIELELERGTRVEAHALSGNELRPGQTVYVRWPRVT